MLDRTQFLVPEGFVAHDGTDIPAGMTGYAELLINTAAGVGSTGVVKLPFQFWNDSYYPDGIGAVLGYQATTKGADPMFEADVRWPLAEPVPVEEAPAATQAD